MRTLVHGWVVKVEESGSCDLSPLQYIFLFWVMCHQCKMSERVFSVPIDSHPYRSKMVKVFLASLSYSANPHSPEL